LLELEVLINVLLHLVPDLPVLLGLSTSDAEPDAEDVEEEDGEADHDQVLVIPGFWFLEINLVAESLLEVICGVAHLWKLVYVVRLADLAEDGLTLHFSCVLTTVDVDRGCVVDTILYSLESVFFKNWVDVTVSSTDCRFGHAPLDLLGVDPELANDSIGTEVSDRALLLQTTEPDVVQVVEPEVSIVLIVFVDFIEDAFCPDVLSQHHCFINEWELRNHLFVRRSEAVQALLDAVQVYDFLWAEGALECLYAGNEDRVIHQGVLVFIQVQDQCGRKVEQTSVE